MSDVERLIADELAHEQRLAERRPPARSKPPEDWTVADHLQHRATGVEPESEAYRAYVRKVHEDAGMQPPDEHDKPLDAMSVADHLDRIQRSH